MVGGGEHLALHSGESAKSNMVLVWPRRSRTHWDVRASQSRTTPSVDVLRVRAKNRRKSTTWSARVIGRKNVNSIKSLAFAGSTLIVSEDAHRLSTRKKLEPPICLRIITFDVANRTCPPDETQSWVSISSSHRCPFVAKRKKEEKGRATRNENALSRTCITSPSLVPTSID